MSKFDETLKTLTRNYLFDNYPLCKDSIDEEVINFCDSDLYYYIEYCFENEKNHDKKMFYDYMCGIIFDSKLLDNDMYVPSDAQIKQYKKLAKKYVTDFIDLWWTKYQSRVRLILENQKLTDNEIEQVNSHNSGLYDNFDDGLTDEEWDDIVSYVENKLLSYGEYAFVGTVAENTVIKAMAKMVMVNNNFGSEEAKVGLMEKINEEIYGLVIDKNRKPVTIIESNVNS